MNKPSDPKWIVMRRARLFWFFAGVALAVVCGNSPANAQSFYLSFLQHYNFDQSVENYQGLELESRLGGALELYKNNIGPADNSYRVGLRVIYHWHSFVECDYRYSLKCAMVAYQHRLWQHEYFSAKIGLAGGIALYSTSDRCGGQEINLNLPSVGSIFQPGLYVSVPVKGDLAIQASLHPTFLTILEDESLYRWGIQVAVGIVLEEQSGQ